MNARMLVQIRNRGLIPPDPEEVSYDTERLKLIAIDMRRLFEQLNSYDCTLVEIAETESLINNEKYEKKENA